MNVTQGRENSAMKLMVKASDVADGSIEGAIRYCKDLEVDQLAVFFNQVPGYQENGYVEAQALRGIKKDAQDAGIVLSQMIGRPERSTIVGAPEGEAHWHSLCKSLGAMGEAGIDTLRIILPEDRPEDPKEVDAAWDLLIGFYRRFMAEAEKNGVRVALHPVASSGMHLVWDYQTTARLLRDVPSPSNGVCFCVGNFWLAEGEGIYDVIRRLGDKILDVHVRSTRQGLGETPFWLDDSAGPDYRRIMKALRDIDYRGGLMPEHMPKVAGEDRAEISTAWTIGYVKAMLRFS
jgi:sugar phosphate isomerase/epimerase